MSGKKDILRKIVKDQTRITLVAEENNAIVGFALGRTDKSGLNWLSFMAVPNPQKARHRSQVGAGLSDRIKDERSTEDQFENGATAEDRRETLRRYGFRARRADETPQIRVDLIIFSRFLQQLLTKKT